jgi:hypothetical protein
MSNDDDLDINTGHAVAVSIEAAHNTLAACLLECLANTADEPSTGAMILASSRSERDDRSSTVVGRIPKDTLGTKGRVPCIWFYFTPCKLNYYQLRFVQTRSV